MSDYQNEDIEILINRLIDGRLDPDQQAALEKRLLRDPEAHAMMRASRALDEECRLAIGATLDSKPQTAEPSTGRTWTIAIALAAAASIAIGVVLWTAIAPRPHGEPPLAGQTPDPGPTAMQPAELAIDRFDPTPVRHTITNPVRRVDRIPVGLYDAESGQMRIILVDREQQKPEPQWLDL